MSDQTDRQRAEAKAREIIQTNVVLSLADAIKNMEHALLSARREALEDAATIADEEGAEWDSDNLQTFKNYAAHTAVRIRALKPKE